MLNISAHGGHFGRNGIILDFPLEKNISGTIPVINANDNFSYYDICGDYILSGATDSANLYLVKLYKLTKEGLTGVANLITTKSSVASGVTYKKFALAKDFFAVQNIVSPYTLTSYDLTGAVKATKTYSGALYDIQSDGTYIYVITPSNTIEKLDSMLNVISSTTVPTGMYNYQAANLYYPNLWVPKGNSNPYIYWTYPIAGFIVVSKRLKSNLTEVVQNNNTLESKYQSHIIGVDYERDVVYCARTNGNPYSYITVLNSNLTKVYEVTYNFNDMTSGYCTSPIFGKDEVMLRMKYRNNSGSDNGFLKTMRINRNTYAVVWDSGSIVPTTYNNPVCYYVPIAYDIGQRKYFRGYSWHAPGIESGTNYVHEGIIGFAKI